MLATLDAAEGCRRSTAGVSAPASPARSCVLAPWLGGKVDTPRLDALSPEPRATCLACPPPANAEGALGWLFLRARCQATVATAPTTAPTLAAPTTSASVLTPPVVSAVTERLLPAWAAMASWRPSRPRSPLVVKLLSEARRASSQSSARRHGAQRIHLARLIADGSCRVGAQRHRPACRASRASCATG